MDYYCGPDCTCDLLVQALEKENDQVYGAGWPRRDNPHAGAHLGVPPSPDLPGRSPRS